MSDNSTVVHVSLDGDEDEEGHEHQAAADSGQDAHVGLELLSLVARVGRGGGVGREEVAVLGVRRARGRVVERAQVVPGVVGVLVGQGGAGLEVVRLQGGQTLLVQAGF